MKYNVCYLKIRKEKDNLYLAANQNFELHFFNETIAKILNYIENGFCKSEIIDCLKNEYNVDTTQLNEDVTKAIDYLEVNEFIIKERNV